MKIEISDKTRMGIGKNTNAHSHIYQPFSLYQSKSSKTFSIEI